MAPDAEASWPSGELYAVGLTMAIRRRGFGFLVGSLLGVPVRRMGRPLVMSGGSGTPSLSSRSATSSPSASGAAYSATNGSQIAENLGGTVARGGGRVVVGY
jgi:hypothetical protein